jgi:mannose-6-phosphate isomerase class I
MLKAEHRRPLPAVQPQGAEEYLRRYLDAFPPGILRGLRVLVWQHSAVGRDLLVRALAELGAEALPAGRTEAFLPIDTEAVDQGLLANVQALVDAAAAGGAGPLDAVVSTDGDGDRPLLLAVGDGQVRFVSGDLLGLLTAEYLGATDLTVPVSASDALELFFRGRPVKLRRTRIGSPYVIAEMRQAGWENNGGFLTAAPLRVPGGGRLEPLPTRDALLPLLCVLAASRGRGLDALLDRLPRRFSRSALQRPYPRERFAAIAAALAPPRAGIREARFPSADEGLRRVQLGMEEAFPPAEGFSPVAWVNWLDGLRVGFADGRIAHLRASGNAPELRLYAVADSPDGADRLAEHVLQGGALVRLEALAEERRAAADFAAAPRPLLLRGAVQHYAWGGTRFIPELLGRSNDENKPWAELWLGAHPRGPAAVLLEKAPGGWLALDRLIRAAPEAVLGRSAARRFGGELPFLLKVLDARDTLSIQVHPSRRKARQGFARETAAGLAQGSPERSYPDANPKLEAQAALSRVWMLHGFRPLREIAALPALVPELAEILGGPAELLSVRRLCSRLMNLPQETVDAVLGPLLARLEKREPADQGSPDYWALRASRQHPGPGGGIDRGIFWIYLLNLVGLEPGQGTFQPVGLPHAYLEGTAVELMSNSDNVLRGGLTSKKVEAAELLRAAVFRCGRPRILRPRAVSPVEWVYPTPAREFRLSRLELPAGGACALDSRGPSCLLLTAGAAELEGGGGRLELARGAAALVPAGPCTARAGAAGPAVLYRASLP